MHPALIGLIIVAVIYLIGLVWSHHYWSKHMNDNNIVLIPEEVQVIVPMLFGWFFFWDGIAVIMKHANREDQTPNLHLASEE